jgi:hypothetical protein
MGLLGGIARTAVIAGTATAVSNRVSRRQGNRWAAKEQQQYEAQQYEAQQRAPQYPPQQYQPQQYQAPPPAAAPVSGMDAKIAQLKQLGELKQSGILTDAEFEAQKARILAT